MQSALIAARACQLLDYAPATGALHHRVTRGPVKAGAVAGHSRARDGRVTVSIDGRSYLASHVAWAIMTGEWPTREVEHRDTDPTNDRWDNLRLATHQQNSFNRRKPRSNTSGFKGVCWHAKNKMFRARITVNGKEIGLGYFPNAWRAYRAYCTAARELHGEFGRAV